MTETLKVLGQQNPAATTLTTLYTCASAFGATGSSIVVCNQAAVASYFSVSVAVGGASDNPSQYLYFELYIDANDTFIATIGMTLSDTDVVRVWASSATVSFTLFGAELS
jgi:hypothetical protein